MFCVLCPAAVCEGKSSFAQSNLTPKIFQNLAAPSTFKFSSGHRKVVVKFYMVQLELPDHRLELMLAVSFYPCKTKLLSHTLIQPVFT